MGGGISGVERRRCLKTHNYPGRGEAQRPKGEVILNVEKKERKCPYVESWAYAEVSRQCHKHLHQKASPTVFSLIDHYLRFRVSAPNPRADLLNLNACTLLLQLVLFSCFNTPTTCEFSLDSILDPRLFK